MVTIPLLNGLLSLGAIFGMLRGKSAVLMQVVGLLDPQPLKSIIDQIS